MLAFPRISAFCPHKTSSLNQIRFLNCHLWMTPRSLWLTQLVFQLCIEFSTRMSRDASNSSCSQLNFFSPNMYFFPLWERHIHPSSCPARLWVPSLSLLFSLSRPVSLVLPCPSPHLVFVQFCLTGCSFGLVLLTSFLES